MDSADLESYRTVAGAVVGGAPLFLALVAGYVPRWLKGFATERPKPVPSWWPWTVGAAAVVLALAGFAGFMLNLRSSEDEPLLHEDFWAGVRDGVFALGFGASLVVILLLLLLRAVVNAARGGKTYKPHEELNVKQLQDMAEQGLADLKRSLDEDRSGGPAAAQAADCLNLADGLFRNRSEGGRGVQIDRLLAASVLCRAGAEALRTRTPMAPADAFCWANPLHGRAVTLRALAYGDQKTVPRSLCRACDETLGSGARPAERVLVLPMPSNGGFVRVPSFHTEFFEYERPTNLHSLTARVRHGLEFLERGR